MTYQEYQTAASRTCVNLSTNKANARHMKMGVMSEIGELIDAYKKELAYGKTLDLINIGEEWADVSWYLANEATRVGIQLVEETIDDEIKNDIKKFIEENNVEDILWDFGFAFKTAQSDDKDNSSHANIQDGFIMWVYIGENLLNINTNKALENNIAKLKARYPLKFESELALNRNLDNERKELEK